MLYVRADSIRFSKVCRRNSNSYQPENFVPLQVALPQICIEYLRDEARVVQLQPPSDSSCSTEALPGVAGTPEMALMILFGLQKNHR